MMTTQTALETAGLARRANDMKRLYYFLADNLPYIALVLVLGLIPDLLLRGIIPAIHAAVIAFVVIVLLAGTALRLDG